MAIGRKTGGRQKGTPNKITSAFKDAMLLAYKRIGGDRALADWARENPTEFYKLMSKLLPHEMSLSAEVDVVRDPLTDFEIARRIAFVLAAAGQRVEDLPAKQVETLPPLMEVPPTEESETVDCAMVESEPFGIPGSSMEPEAELTIHNYFGSAAEQGATNRFAQHPRIIKRPRSVIRRRRDLI